MLVLSYVYINKIFEIFFENPKIHNVKEMNVGKLFVLKEWEFNQWSRKF